MIETAPAPGGIATALPLALAPDGASLLVDIAGSPRSRVLDTGTPIRMIGGLHLGCTGVVCSVQHRPSSQGVEALYQLEIQAPGTPRTRISVKQSSLGRIWVKAMAPCPAGPVDS